MEKIDGYAYDFAISYAGEDLNIAKEIKQSIIEKSRKYSIFLASDEQSTLVGKDGEKFFEDLFKNSKQVIVLFSENYKRKDWPRFEFDVIRKRDEKNRFIPIKLDEVQIHGLPSTIFYIHFSNNAAEIAEIAIKKLITFEMDNGIQRETEFQKKRRVIENSKGALDRAYQLVVDNRERTPLENIDCPDGDFQKSYSIISLEDVTFSKISRIKVKINIPAGLSKEAVEYNIKHCNTSVFNEHKPEAIAIHVYSNQASNFLGFDDRYNVASSNFALYGEWDRAEESFAYNMPVSKFGYHIEFEESYFNKNIKILPGSEIAKNHLYELFEEKISEFIRDSPDTKTGDVLKNFEKIKPVEVKKMLKNLKKKKLIRKVGPKYNWHWEIVNK